jgi:hypothetical protein
VVESDNASTVSFIKRGTTKNAVALQWLKRIFYCSLRYDFQVTARHIPGVTNVLPDALSRLTIDAKFAKIFAGHFYHPFPGPALPNHPVFSYAEDGNSSPSTGGTTRFIDGSDNEVYEELPVEFLH